MDQTVENNRQNLARKLVEREVMCCASTLMSGMAQLSSHVSYRAMQDAFCTDQDEMMGLFERPDYEEAARYFVMSEADITQLEEVADENGYWSDVLRECGVPEGLDDIEEYLEAHPEKLDTIKAAVWALVNTQDAFTEVCQKHDLEPDRIEVYEHWVVSEWLAKKLAAKGEITGDFAGLTLWGRCCTGQSMALDTVIQDIAEATL